MITGPFSLVHCSTRPLICRFCCEQVPVVEEESAKKKAEEKQQQPDRTALVISHSRNSSDSSGYHEASVLSDTPDNHNGHTETRFVNLNISIYSFSYYP